VRRADRLFQIIQLLRSKRRATTARWLAEQLEVSERTIYRDVRDLVSSGTPIEGEAGVGYSLRREYDLPPLMFDADEVEALVLGARVVAGFGDESLARAARALLSKVEAVLPIALRTKLSGSLLFAPRMQGAAAISGRLFELRSAIEDKRKVRLRYARADGAASERVVRPLAAFFWGPSWTITAWCELRGDFRSFRVDRIEELELLDEHFEDEPGRGLGDYLRSLGPAAERALRG